MIHFVRNAGKNCRNVTLLLLCTEGEQLEKYDDTALLRVNSWRNVVIKLVCTESEKMEEYDDTLCVY